MEENNKIGFDSNFDGKKDIKFKNNEVKTPFQRWTVVFVIIAYSLSLLSLMYAFAPIFSGAVGVVISLVVGLIIAVPTVCTLFLILISDAFRNWVVQIWQFPMWFFDVKNHLAEISIYYPYFAFSAIAFDIVALIFSIVGRVKYQHKNMTYIVFCGIGLLLSIGLVVFYFVNGQSVYRK